MYVTFNTIFGAEIGFSIADADTREAVGIKWGFVLKLLFVEMTISQPEE